MTPEELLAAERAAVEAALPRLLPPEGAWPARLGAAMRYAVLGGGKRVRPVLVRLAHRALGGDPDRVTGAACALELLHTYSLVHDDLPALDDDTLRRGRPTVHVAFDEATAVLVGDALLTEAFRILATLPEGAAWAVRRAEAVAAVAAAAGSRGMVGGQVEDLEATGQVAAGAGAPAEARLRRIHRHKTGALIAVSVELGAVYADADPAVRARLRGWGERLGLAFQVADDILDATATAEELGKSPGKDAAAGKLTYVTLYGLEGARRRLAELEGELLADPPSAELALVARYVCRRRS